MKLLRVWLLLILAVLLPVRAAMAVAMPCGFAGVDMPSEATYHHAGAHGHAGSAHEPGQHDEGGGALHDHEQSSSDKCNLCSASCSATPLLGTIAGVPEPLDRVSVAFPQLYAPAPSFFSDGQERPPRSI